MYVIHLCVFLTTARGSPSHNMRVDARHRRPAAAPRDLARASPALFAQKVLTHHKHLCKSTPPLRKPPTAQKALRALWPWLGHAGSTKFGRPRKTQAFFGAPELRPRAGVRRKAPLPASFYTSLFSARSLGARRASKKSIKTSITRADLRIKSFVFAARSLAARPAAQKIKEDIFKSGKLL